MTQVTPVGGSPELATRHPQRAHGRPGPSFTDPPTGPATRGRGHADMDQLLTVQQAALQLACTPAAIRKWLFQRRLPAVKVGRLTRIRQRDLEAVVTHGLRPLAGAP